MPSRVPPIARIRLARSMPRLLAVPVVLLTAGAATVGVAVRGPLVAPEPAWVALVTVGAALGLAGVAMALQLLTMRLEVHESAVRTSWLGGEHLHPLVPGPVTRVRLRGDNASSLRSRTGWLGWTVGRATLRGEERVKVVRLAPTPTAILVPTEDGRLAIAAASESELIEALSRAARARQRLEELAHPGPPDPVPAAMEPEPEPHILTGIERALLEERRALEGTKADAVAGSVAPPPLVPGAAIPGTIPPPATTGEPARDEGPARRWGKEGARVRLGRPRPSAVFVLLPLLGTGGVWLAAGLNGGLPEPGTDLGRLTALGLVLAGPATSVGAIMARAWWPRLVGVVVTSGLATAVFVGRALLGG